MILVLVSMALVEKIKQTRIEDAESPKKLIIEDKKPLVLFGEANFTHAVAIAALRESSWDGITATSLYGDLLETCYFLNPSIIF